MQTYGQQAANPINPGKGLTLARVRPSKAEGFSRRPRAFTPSRKSLLAMNTFAVSFAHVQMKDKKASVGAGPVSSGPRLEEKVGKNEERIVWKEVEGGVLTLRPPFGPDNQAVDPACRRASGSPGAG